MEIQPGHRIAAKFEVERVIGRGGMGLVVLARHLVLDERVAIKLLFAEGAADPTDLARFVREAKAMMRIKSEHAVRVLDVSIDGGTPYMVMEYLEGQDLDHVVQARGGLPVPEAVDYVLQACEAVAEAHAQGIVHRDLKPANLFASKATDGSVLVKVLDFGISKIAPAAGDQAAALTHTSAVMGTPLFMSPEQMRTTRTAKEATDIWAIGVVLYHLLTGSYPFFATTVPEMCAMILSDPPAPLRAKRADLPVELEAVIMRCLEKVPEQRFADVSELARALAPFSPASAASVERIARVTAAKSRPSLVDVAPSDASASYRIGPSPVVSTAASFSRTQRTGRSPLVPAIVAGVVALGFVAVLAIAAVVLLARPNRATSTATAPPSATALPVPAAPPSAPAASSAVAPSSASAAPAASSAAPPVPASTTARPHATTAPVRKYGGRQ